MGDERREYDGSGHGDEPAGGQRGPDDTRAFDPISESEQPSSGDPQVSGDPDATVAGRPLDPEETVVAAPDPEATAIARPDPDVIAIARPDPDATAIARPDPDVTAIARPDPDTAAAAGSDPEETVVAAPDPAATAIARPDPDTAAAAGSDPEATAIARPDPDATVIRRAPVTPDSTSVLPQDGTVWSGRAGVPPPGGPNLRDPVPYRDAADYGEPPRDGQRRWWTPVLLGVVALGLLGVVVLAAWWMSRDQPGPEPSPTEIPAPTLAPETSAPAPAPTTAAPSPTVALVQVPQLVGISQDRAAATLDALGLSYRFEYRQSAEPQGEVIASTPREGEIVPSSTTVTLVISTGPAPRTTTATPRPPQPSASAEPGEGDDGNGGAGE